MFFTAVLSGTAVFLDLLARIIVRKWNRSRNGKQKFLFKGLGMILVISFSFGVGAWIYAGAADDAEKIRKFCRDGSSYDIYGCITELEERKESGAVYVLLEHVRIEDDVGFVKIHGNVQLVFEEASVWLRPGRAIRLTGVYSEFQEPRNEGSFDSQTYYYSLGIYGRFYAEPEDIQWVKRTYSRFRNGLRNIRRNMQNHLYNITEEKYASILSGILLGCKSEIDAETKELYQIAGISHLLSISGLHISLLGMCVYRLMRKRFRFAGAGGVASVFILSYGMMTGGGVSAKRAVIMFLVGILADITGRTYDVLSALSLAAILITVKIPMAPESAAMQLSFGAILGIVLTGRTVAAFLNIESKMVRTIVTSECINLITRPVIAVNFYQTALYSTLINLVVLPVFGIVLCSGFICILFGYVCVEISRFMILLPVGILKLYEVLCRTYEMIPGAVRITGKPPVQQLFLYYGAVVLITGFLWILVQKRSGRPVGNNCQNNFEEFWYIRLARKTMIISAFVLLNLLVLYGSSRENCIKMLDVGQGDSIFIGTEHGTNLLIDAGSSNNSRIAEYEILPFLKANGVESLSYLMVTHTDQDHISGMIPLLTAEYGKRPYVKCLVLPDIGEEFRDESYHHLEETAVEHGISVIYLSAGMEITENNLRISSIYPSKEIPFRDKNELSLNCIVSVNGITAMFTGDLEAQGEDLLIRSGRLERCHILKVAHHGSDGSSGEEYLRLIQPDTALISCSKNNRYGHPAAETLKRLEAVGSQIYITRDSGQITLRIGKKGGYTVERFRD
ncbi:MAG: DNA internalization-related competence protein ComEC/Rec2 [Lachnospiraceae bacterium]|nr:DNA internalization-related competence protein ComEC/Rec2 [Lachnospiraceae bacterium]